MVTNVAVKDIKRAHSIHLNPFIDDFSHLCHGPEAQAKEEFALAKKLIPQWGFEISIDKLVEPKQENMILGYILNTKSLKIFFDQAKLKELEFLLYTAIQPVIRVRYLAKLIGKLYALGYASRVPVSAFLPRSIKAVAEVTRNQDWRAWRKLVTITPAIHEELVFLLKQLPKWNGVKMKKPYKIHFYESDRMFEEEEMDAWVGDSSAEATAVYNVRSTFKFQIQYFEDSLCKTSSARRELAALELLVLKRGDLLEADTTVVYASDNTALNRWINAGSCKPEIAVILQRIFLECDSRGIEIRVTWIPRSHPMLQHADLLSRRDTDEFSLRLRDSDYIKRQYPGYFSLDPFASEFLHQTEIFYSRFPAPKSSGTDGLHQPWRGHHVWLFPPRKLLPQTIYRLFTEVEFRGALVGLDNAEGIIKDFLFTGGHAPSYCYKVFRFPVKIRMGTAMNSPDKIVNAFGNNWHDLVVLFIDKSWSQRDKRARCFYGRGQCQECGGNPCVTDVKIYY